MFTLESIYFGREKYYLVQEKDTETLLFHGITGQKNIKENEYGNWFIDSLKETQNSGSNAIAVAKFGFGLDPVGLQTWQCNDGCNFTQNVRFKIHNVNIFSILKMPPDF